ncbi:PREDICTED: gibberellin 3-beta-dioxygenase 2-like [Ipomoea nil]|uniref:gibberellin 3-beta-dioxygenase 2-like n=1 Tax=Ipomoea nil TaxID=35883 RepID=UPI000900CCA4|nr:PREDICTED: gibberellin 3-beta-dioxygenase 2-like [Ipomoea nil]
MNRELDHLVPMDFKNADQVPDTHTWVDSPCINSSSSDESVPLIDLEDLQAVEKIKMACENWGVFQVINHGIPVALFAEIENQARRFFALPREQKLLTLRSPGSPTGYGIIPISRVFNSLMWMEGFTMSGSPMEIVRRVWPQDYSPFCTAIDDYQEKLMGLAVKITSLIFKSLGLSDEDVEWFNPKSTEAFLHLNSYPKCPDPTRALGMVAHTDSSLITLLYQSNTDRGLQVIGPNHNWVDVEPISDAIVVNVSDLLQITSNGRFKSVTHRAIVSEAHHRISIPFFFGPKIDVNISSPLKLINDGDFSMYRPISWKEYREIKGVHFDKALEAVRFNNSVVIEKDNAQTTGNEASLGDNVEALKV